MYKYLQWTKQKGFRPFYNGRLLTGHLRDITFLTTYITGAPPSFVKKERKKSGNESTKSAPVSGKRVCNWLSTKVPLFSCSNFVVVSLERGASLHLIYGNKPQNIRPCDMFPFIAGAYCGQGWSVLREIIIIVIDNSYKALFSGGFSVTFDCCFAVICLLKLYQSECSLFIFVVKMNSQLL